MGHIGRKGKQSMEKVIDKSRAYEAYRLAWDDRVQEGERFQAGRYVSGIYADCDIRLDEFRETGRNVLRAVIPDRQNRFPEDPQCEEPYRLQSMDTEDLYEREGSLS